MGCIELLKAKVTIHIKECFKDKNDAITFLQDMITSRTPYCFVNKQSRYLYKDRISANLSGLLDISDIEYLVENWNDIL